MPGKNSHLSQRKSQHEDTPIVHGGNMRQLNVKQLPTTSHAHHNAWTIMEHVLCKSTMHSCMEAC